MCPDTVHLVFKVVSGLNHIVHFIELIEHFKMHVFAKSPSIQVYELADIAAILGMEKSRVKNWTIGRPFSVRPSVRASVGKGSRNLFSRNDIFCFALVKRLNEIGVPVTAIQNVLKKMEAELPRDEFWKSARWLHLQRTNRDTSFAIAIDVDTFGYENVTIEAEDEFVCFYALNMKVIEDLISTKIHMFEHGRLPTWKISRRAKAKRLRH